MGKGDKRSRRGKIVLGTYGNSRARTKKAAVTKGGAKVGAKKPAPKKAPGKKT